MKKVASYLSSTRSILIMLVVLFSLSPCTVKESIYQIIGTEYQRPVNKTKATQSFQNTCQSSVFSVSQKVKVTKLSDFDLFRLAFQYLKPIMPAYKTETWPGRKEVWADYNEPLFILYKRFKIGL